MTDTQTSNVTLINETTSFNRFVSEPGTEALEIRVHSRMRTQLGVIHEVSQSVVLSGEEAQDTLSAIRVIQNNLKLTLMRRQEELNKASVPEPETEASVPEPETTVTQ